MDNSASKPVIPVPTLVDLPPDDEEEDVWDLGPEDEDPKDDDPEDDGGLNLDEAPLDEILDKYSDLIDQALDAVDQGVSPSKGRGRRGRVKSNKHDRHRLGAAKRMGKFVGDDLPESDPKWLAAQEANGLLAGLTKKDIDGVTVSTKRAGAVMECHMTLMANGSAVSAPIRIHLSLQRHWWNAMDSTEAKPKNSLMLPKISEADIKKDLEDVAAELGRFFMSRPTKFPTFLKAKAASGRIFTLDTIGLKAAHCFVTGGTDVVYLPHGEFVSLKSVRDLSEQGRPVYINKVARNETVGIVQRHGCATKAFFKKAAIFPIDAEVLTLLQADLELA